MTICHMLFCVFPVYIFYLQFVLDPIKGKAMFAPDNKAKHAAFCLKRMSPEWQALSQPPAEPLF